MVRGARTMAKTHYQGPRKSSSTTNAAGASSPSSSPPSSSSSSLPSSSSPSPFSVKSATGCLVLKYGSFGRFSSEMKHETGTSYDFTPELTALMKQTIPKGTPFEVRMDWMVGCGSAGHTTQCGRATSSTTSLRLNCRSLGMPASTSLGELAGCVLRFQLLTPDSDATIYYAHDDINGNPAYEVVSVREVVAQCRDSNRPRNGQRFVTDMEAGHAQRLCKLLSSLALNGSTSAALHCGPRWRAQVCRAQQQHHSSNLRPQRWPLTPLPTPDSPQRSSQPP